MWHSRIARDTPARPITCALPLPDRDGGLLLLYTVFSSVITMTSRLMLGDSMTAKTRLPPCSSTASSPLPLRLREISSPRTISAASLRVKAEGARCACSNTKLASCWSRFVGVDPPHPTAKHSPQESLVPTAWVTPAFFKPHPPSIRTLAIRHLLLLLPCPCPVAADPLGPVAPASSSPSLPLTPVSLRRRLTLATCATLFSCPLNESHLR
jgi:hypothetical protein